MPVPGRHRSGIRRSLLLVGLLILPLLAVLRAGGSTLWIGGYAVLISVVTYLVYAWDKHRARAGAWRVAEIRLHFLELLGGWPGAYVAQGILRHKCAKRSYQIVFWLIVVGYQYLAMDFLLDWQISSLVMGWIGDLFLSR